MAEGDKEGSTSNQNSGRFLDSLVMQWMKKTGSNISLPRADEPQSGSSSAESLLREKNRTIEDLTRKLNKSQQLKASLAASLQGEARCREELEEKLTATWETIDIITNYYNYISESLATFQQHRANLSSLYDNVIKRQQETVGKLKSDCDNYIAQLRDKALHEERLRDAIAEQSRLRKQLENSEHELALKQSELASTEAEELTHIRELQQLSVEYGNLQSRLQSVEKERCDVKELAAQLENKVLIQEEKTQQLATERNELREQLKNAEHELNAQIDKLVDEHNDEKKVLLEEQRQLLLQVENLQSLLNALQHEKNDITAMITQKDALLSSLENEISTYKNQVENAERNLCAEKNKLLTAHAEEKNRLLEDQRRLLSELENLKSRLNVFEQDKRDITEIIAQKDALLSSLETEISTYKNQSENAEQTLRTEKNKLLTVHAEEKTSLLEDQRRLLSELEKLKSRLNVFEQNKKDVTEIIAQKDLLLANLENKISLHIKQIETAEQNSHTEKTKLTNAHTQEKQLLLEAQRQLVSEVETLQSQLKALQNEKKDIAKVIAEKDALLSNLESKVSTYENQKEAMAKKQTMLEVELSAKKEMIQNLLTVSNGHKQRETQLINDLNRIEKKLNSETEYSKNLKDRLSRTEKDLSLTLEERDKANEILKTTEKELQLLKTLRDEEKEKRLEESKNEDVPMRSAAEQPRKQKSAKRKYDVRLFGSDVAGTNQDGQKNVSTSADLDDDDNPSSSADSRSPQVLGRALYSTERESQKEQEAEVTSVGKKFFLSRPPLRRTYSKRR